MLRVIALTMEKGKVTTKFQKGLNKNIQVYLMKEYQAIGESSAIQHMYQATGKMPCQKLQQAYSYTLTEAQCKRKEEGASIRTGQELRTHAATAIAWKKHDKFHFA